MWLSCKEQFFVFLSVRLNQIILFFYSVYRNGDPLTLPAKVLLVKPTLQNWESVLDEITRKVTLSNSAVLKYINQSCFFRVYIYNICL